MAVAALLQADPRLVRDAGTPCLERAARLGHDSVVRVLLHMGLPPTESSLQEAVAGAHLSTVRALLHAGATTDSVGVWVAAGQHADAAMLKALVAASDGRPLGGVRPLLSNAAVRASLTAALSRAAAADDIELCRVLLGQGLSPTAATLRDAATAASEGQHGVLSALLAVVGGRAGLRPLLDGAGGWHGPRRVTAEGSPPLLGKALTAALSAAIKANDTGLISMLGAWACRRRPRSCERPPTPAAMTCSSSCWRASAARRAWRGWSAA